MTRAQCITISHFFKPKKYNNENELFYHDLLLVIVSLTDVIKVLKTLHRQFGEILSESLESLKVFVIDMLMFDSKAIRNKFELRFYSWTVLNWKSVILLLCFCLEFISYHSRYHKHFCIKCFCCFEFRKAQKHIYCQRRRQFNRF